jgi:hypothetical protein
MYSNRERVIDAIALEFEEIYAVINQIRASHQIDNARGDSLEAIGSLLNIDRLQDQVDNDYRATIEGLSTVRLGAGTKVGIVAYLENYLLLNSNEFDVLEISPCHIQIRLITDLLSRETEIEESLADAVAAGIHYDIVYNDATWDDAHYYLSETYEDRWR